MSDIEEIVQECLSRMSGEHIEFLKNKDDCFRKLVPGAAVRQESQESGDSVGNVAVAGGIIGRHLGLELRPYFAKSYSGVGVKKTIETHNVEVVVAVLQLMGGERFLEYSGLATASCTNKYKGVALAVDDRLGQERGELGIFRVKVNQWRGRPSMKHAENLMLSDPESVRSGGIGIERVAWSGA